MASEKKVAQASVESLTTRELRVVDLVGEGLQNKQIADLLKVSTSTVQNHLRTIFRKVGVSDRLNLAFYAYRHGLAKVPTWSRRPRV